MGPAEGRDRGAGPLGAVSERRAGLSFGVSRPERIRYSVGRVDLCEDCGLCCTGELFASIEVAIEETARLASRRLPLAIEAGRAKAPQPCPAHDGRCSIYAERPRACAAFRCAPLIAVESGAQSMAEAASLLARGKRLARSVRARVPGDGALFRDLELFVEDTPQWRRANAELLLDIAVLRTTLDRIRGD